MKSKADLITLDRNMIYATFVIVALLGHRYATYKVVRHFEGLKQ